MATSIPSQYSEIFQKKKTLIFIYLVCSKYPDYEIFVCKHYKKIKFQEIAFLIIPAANIEPASSQTKFRRLIHCAVVIW